MEGIEMGYVVNKRDRWYAVGYEGIDPVTGRDRRRWHPATDETSARLIAASLPAARGTAAHGMTLARFIRTRWLPARQDRLRPTTFHRYRQMTELYVLPHLGRVPLRRLTIAHLQGLYSTLRVSGGHDGRSLAPKTVLNAHQVLRTALGDAERQGLVARNVAAMMDPPCCGTAPEQSCWNQAELRTFLQAAAKHRLAPALWLTAMTGMRRGEVLGLRWSDIDLASRRLSLQRSVTCTGYRVHTTPTKTRTSRRSIDLDDATVHMLVDWRTAQARELGGDERDRVVFTRKNGEPLHPHVLSQTFERVAAAAGLPRIRLHDLRHTHATLLLQAGVPIKVVSERLGHASPAFTMSVYQHVLPGMQRDAADTFARLVAEPNPKIADVVPVDKR